MDNLGASLGKIIELSPIPILIFNTEGTLILKNNDGNIFLKKECLKPENECLVNRDFKYLHIENFSNIDLDHPKYFDRPVKHKIEKLKLDTREFYMVIVILEGNLTSKKNNSARLSDQELIADISHELRTPLNGILGFSEIILKKSLSVDKIKEYAQIIYANGMYMLQLVNSLIDYARLKSNELVINKKLFSINRMLYELVVFFMMDLQNRNKEHLLIRVNQGLSDGLDIIYADELRIRQVFNNLISNAIKFTEKGTINIGYKVIDDSYLLFFVEDTGVGIAPDEIKNIFVRYKQANKKIASNFGGSGLGLSISKEIVELHGGSIWVESEVNKGTTFYFKIPYEKIDHKK